MENLTRLKELRYLNLTLNLIERIEGLEQCEFLWKLDLTCNFVVDLLSVAKLAKNTYLRILFCIYICNNLYFNVVFLQEILAVCIVVTDCL
jgi:protein TilB